MAEKLKIGIVGCGSVVQQTHIPAFMGLKDVTLQAVCDRNENLARETGATFHIPGVYADLSEMLSVEKLGVVDICTPPQTHTPLAMEALKRGCHVLIEKPMALKVSDCDKMIDAANEMGVKLCIVHNKLFDPPFLRARKLVTEGVIGDFTGMRIFLSDPRDEMIMRKDYWIHKLPGGIIGETGPHVVYMSLAFLNSIKNVDIYAKNFLEHPWAPFDEFRMELEGERAMSSVTLSYSGNHRDLYVDILGTEGVLHLDLCARLLVHYGKKTSVRPIPFLRYFSSVSSQIIGGLAQNAFELIMGRLRLGHKTLIEEFISSILNNSQPPVTTQEGRETVRVMEMIVERFREKYGI